MVTEEEKLQPGHYTEKAKTKTIENWHSTMPARTLLIIVGVVAGIALLLIVISLLRTAFSSAGAGMAGSSPYTVLQRQVDEAFDNGGQSSTSGGSSSASAPAQGERPETPQEQQTRRMEEEQELLRQQEELREQQREMVPSVLPENAPTPAPLDRPY